MTMQSSTDQNASDQPTQPIAEGIALRDVSAEDERDLMFLKGERVALIKRLSNNFCLGYCEGVYGRFRASDVAFPELTEGQGDLLAHQDNKSRSVPALADRGQLHDTSVLSNGTPQRRVAPVQQQQEQQHEPCQQKQKLLEPSPSNTKTVGQTQGHMQHRRQPSLPRRMKSDENLSVKPEPPVSARRKVLSSAPLNYPRSMAEAVALAPPIIPPRSSSRNSQKHHHHSTAISSRPSTPISSHLLSPLPPPPPITANRDHGGLVTSQSVSRLFTPRPERNPSRPTSKRSSTSDSGFQQSSNPNQSSISIADYASEGTGDEDDDEIDDEELEKLESEHANHDGKDTLQCPNEEQQQQQRSNRGSTSMVDQLRAKTKNAFQRVGFSLAPNARLFSDTAGKDIDLKVTRLSTYSTASNAASTISLPQQLAPKPPFTVHLAPTSKGASGVGGASSGSGRVRQKSANHNEPEQAAARDNNSPRLIQRIRSWSVSNNQRPKLLLRDADAPEVPPVDPKHLTSVAPTSQSSDGMEDQEQKPPKSLQQSENLPEHQDEKQPEQQPDQQPELQPEQQLEQETEQKVEEQSEHQPEQQPEQQQQQQPERRARRDPSWLSPPTGTAKGRALAEGRPYSLGQGIAGGRADFGARSSIHESNATATTTASTTASAPPSSDNSDTAMSSEGAENKIPQDRTMQKTQDPKADLVVDSYGFILDTSDDHTDAASAITNGGASSIVSSQSGSVNGTGNGGNQEDSSWFPTSKWPEKRDVARRAARIRHNELKWIQLMSSKHPSKVKKTARFKKLVREGIPPSLRGRVWLYLANADMYRQPGLYEELIRRETIPIHEVIERDIHRCYPDHIHFRSDQGEGQRDLRNVLRAYAHYKPQVGYCQGMGRLVGMMLMQMLAEDAFWLLVATIEGYLQDYYTPNLLQLRIDARVFDLLLKEHDPQLREHLAKNDIIPVLYMTPWFLTLFTMSLPWASVLRVWDVFYFDGTRALFRVGLGILHLSRDHLLNNCPTSSELLAYILHIPMDLLSPKPLLDATFRSRLHQSTLDRLTATASQAVKEEEAAKRRARE
ncbi:hypothetical protein BGW42_004414 [Actinomortierella wolfii]|nr:hypothetical protein BGW42_004414 [Actinomortierella wolfii]